MKMKKVLVILLSILMLGACTPKQEVSDAPVSRLEAIRQNGKIVVAMEGTWQPFTYHDENNNQNN